MEDDDIETWILQMSAEALLRARAFVRECEERGLHEYDEAQIRLEASETLEDVLLWSQVWEYVQVRLYAGWNDRVLFDLTTEKGGKYGRNTEVSNEQYTSDETR